AGLPNVVHSFGGRLPAHRVASAQEWVAPLWEARRLEPEPYCGAYRHLYLDICPPSLQAGPAAHLPEVQALRPGAFATGEEQPLPDWVADPGRSPAPLVYVTFGTVFNERPEVIATVVEALRDLPVRVVATVGPMLDPARLGPQPDHVHVAGYIPQTQVLAHCSAVVSHAGSGTFLAAVAEGLPQLCLPQAADQFANAAACARSGAGLALQPGEVTVQGVRAAAGRLLAEASFRTAAARLAAELRAMPDPSEVAAVLAARFGPAART
ncbi:MAG TPA: glycosyltransferase, partial [Acidimicrobiales bacterium]|nr:glycosyltransferase [Acidimicrobiales bacterium]